MNVTKRQIWVTFQVEGLHRYPAAENMEALADVNFLAFTHRHIFHFKVYIDVVHNDRDIEFIQFKRWCQLQYAGGLLKLDFKSCEMISDDLAAAIKAKWPNRNVAIEVAEDGENGSYIEYA